MCKFKSKPSTFSYQEKTKIKKLYNDGVSIAKLAFQFKCRAIGIERMLITEGLLNVN